MGNIVKNWKFEFDPERECFKLLKVDDIYTEDSGLESTWVADVYEMGEFIKFLEEERESQNIPESPSGEQNQ